MYKVLRSIPIEQTPIQSGLVFWTHITGSTVKLNNVNAVTDLYDVRDTGKTGTLYPKFTATGTSGATGIFKPDSAYIDVGSSFSKSMSSTFFTTGYNPNVKSIFLVCKSSAYNAYVGVGGATGFLGVLSSGNVYGFEQGLPIYVNNKKDGSNTDNTNNWVILHTFNPLNLTISHNQLVIGRFNNISVAFYVKSVGVYNRLLSEKEVLYNIEVLNKLYTVF